MVMLFIGHWCCIFSSSCSVLYNHLIVFSSIPIVDYEPLRKPIIHHVNSPLEIIVNSIEWSILIRKTQINLYYFSGIATFNNN